MRIVIEIDYTDTHAEPGARPPTVSVRVEGAVAQPPEAASGASLAETPASVPGADPMSTDAGAAAAPAPAGGSEVPTELLARAAALDALDAGPGPDLAAGAPIRTLVTEADSCGAVAALGDDPAAGLPPSSLEAVPEGGVTNAGPAPP